LNTRTLVTAALLVATGIVLNMVIRIPLLPNAPFLEYSPADVPTLLGTFAFGPIIGVLIAALRAILFSVLAATGGVIGATMDLVAGVMLTGVAGLVYQFWKTRMGAALAIVAGSVAMITSLVALNFFWAFPAFGVPRELVWTTALPFNLIKAALNGVIVFFLYKPLSTILHGRRGEETA